MPLCQVGPEWLVSSQPRQLSQWSMRRDRGLACALNQSPEELAPRFPGAPSPGPRQEVSLDPGEAWPISPRIVPFSAKDCV